MFDRLDAPNVIGVLLDRPVAGEVAGLGDVDDARMTPFRMVAVAFGDFLLGLAVGLEVLEDEVFVVPVEEGRVEPSTRESMRRRMAASSLYICHDE